MKIDHRRMLRYARRIRRRRPDVCRHDARVISEFMCHIILTDPDDIAEEFP